MDRLARPAAGIRLPKSKEFLDRDSRCIHEDVKVPPNHEFENIAADEVNRGGLFDERTEGRPRLSLSSS
jgi:hypothetical protein